MSFISVVILNFNRPDFIKNDIIKSIKKNKNIDEILISHGKESTYFEMKEVKSLKHYGKMNEEYGLALRFLTGALSKNNYVMIIDDDIIPTDETINFLYQKIIKEPDIIHGIYGRDISKGYSVNNVFGEIPIVLTRCLMTTKGMCNYFMKHFRNYENNLIKNAKPYWNGEDILFSLLSIERSKKLNKSYDLSHYNRVLNYLNFSESISFKKDHIDYRNEITTYFLEKLDIENITKKSRILHKKNQIIYFIKNSILVYFFYGIIVIIILSIIKKYF